MPGGETPTALSYQGNITLPTAIENEGSATGPAAGATIVTLSPVPGTYTVSWTVGFSSGSPVAADANNFGLYLGPTLLLTSANPASLAETAQSLVQVTEPVSATAVAVKAIGAGTAGVVYAAQVSLVPVQSVSPDDPLAPYNPMTIDGASVNVTSTPANLAVTMAGFDLSAQAECQIFRGANVPSGTSDFGPVDTTYLPTQAQQLQGMQACQF